MQKTLLPPSLRKTACYAQGIKRKVKFHPGPGHQSSACTGIQTTWWVLQTGINATGRVTALGICEIRKGAGVAKLQLY